MNEKELRAAEYALGTLSHSERLSIERERKSDSELDEYIQFWELKLAPMLESFDAQQPPQYILRKLQKKLAEASKLAPEEANSLREKAIDNARKQLLQLQKKIKRWQLIGLSGYAFSALLLIVVGFKSFNTSPAKEVPFVAVFQQDDAQPAFLMSVDLIARTLKVQSVTAKGLTDQKTYQLWIKSDALGPTPQSLGLLSSIDDPTVKVLDQFTPELIKSALFGISVEPQGGSPTGVPTGPAIHGSLYSVKI